MIFGALGNDNGRSEKVTRRFPNKVPKLDPRKAQSSTPKPIPSYLGFPIPKVKTNAHNRTGHGQPSPNLPTFVLTNSWKSLLAQPRAWSDRMSVPPKNLPQWLSGSVSTPRNELYNTRHTCQSMLCNCVACEGR